MLLNESTYERTLRDMCYDFVSNLPALSVYNPGTMDEENTSALQDGWVKFLSVHADKATHFPEWSGIL